MERTPIVIGSRTAADYLIPILTAAAQYDELIFHFTTVNGPTAEYILRLLRKGCGWVEIGREEVTVTSNACQHRNREGCCRCPTSNYHGPCTLTKRQECTHYAVSNEPRLLKVTAVYIEKVAQARGL